MYRVALDHFDGPLALLLDLIEQKELDITTISLAHVADQFLAYLEASETKNPHELADFLVVAAKLLVLKSKTLFPDLLVEDEPGMPLELQLGIYQYYRQAGTRMEGLIKKKHWTFFRNAPRVVPSFNPPPQLTSETLRDIWKRVCGALEKLIELPRAALAKTITLAERIREIQAFIISEAHTSFKKLSHTAKNKAELIVNFLALLELAKRNIISVQQNALFEDINITHQKST